MLNLTETAYSNGINGNSHGTTSKMIGNVCTLIHRPADQSIKEIHPDLPVCAIAGNCIEPGDPDKSVAPMERARSSDKLRDLKRLMNQNLAL